MAGYGALPKPAGQRARRNKDPNPTTSLVFARGMQPELPDGYDWPDQTHRWWRAWGESSVAGQLTQLDWEYLLGTAILHAKLWERGSTEAAKELRLREESFGVTIAARLRLRIQWIEAQDAEAGSTPEVPSGQSARARRGGLTAVS